MPVPQDWAQQLAAFVQRWNADPAETEHYLGDRPSSTFVLTEYAASWQDYLEWLKELNGGWCFRGQREASWFLDTSLDRAVKVEFSRPNCSGY